MKARRIIFFLLLLFFAAGVSAQRDTSRRKTDTARVKKDTTRARRDTTKIKKDTSRPKPPAPQPVQPDSTTNTDSIAAPVDSVRKDSVIVVSPLVLISDTSSYYAYYDHPFISFGKPPVSQIMSERSPESKDDIFYLLVGVLFFIAITRILFPKYFHNTFRLFFQTSFRQKQTRDQLLQQSLGSLLLNILFFFSSALYLALVLEHYGLTIFPFWELLLYALILIATLYTGKFLFLRFAGWTFNAKDGSETYIFIVFLINKIIGVMLIPFILVIAFADESLVEASVTASVILLLLLFLYRYFVSLKSFRSDLHINPFHFFLYLCGVEIVPLLVIGKAVFNYIDGRF